MQQAPAELDAGAFGCELALITPPDVPELVLWLLDVHVDLEAGFAELGEGERPPFWAFCWGSGQALARFLLETPERVRDRRVVDFGCGSGVVALAAALAGARSVTAVDVDPIARAAARANAHANGLHIETSARMPDDGHWDVLLAADVLYEPAMCDWLVAQSAPGRSVWVCDPERREAPRLPGAPVARLEARTYPDVDSPYAEASIWSLG